jgi:ectoine hydroxylase-related dioxygenase (phytanoyl-CoA dioxygenase family)
MRAIFKDKALQESFEKDGYVVADFLNESEVEHLKQFYYKMEGDVKNLPFASTIMSDNPEYRNLVSSEIKKVFQRGIGEIFDRCSLFFGNYIVKNSGSERSEIPVHQDRSLVDESRYYSLTVWCPLVDLTRENGLLYVVKGSHKLNMNPRGTISGFPYKDILPRLYENHYVEIPLKAGQAVLNSHMLFHGSPPNMSGKERIVAAGILAASESSLRCYYQDPKESPEVMQIYEVPPEYYTTQTLGSKPIIEGSKLVGTTRYTYNVLSEENIDAFINS